MTKEELEQQENYNKLLEDAIKGESASLKIQKSIYGFLGKMVTSSKEQITAQEKINKFQKSFKENLSSAIEDTKNLSNIWLKWNLLDGLRDSLKSMVNMEKSIYRASVNAGKGAAQTNELVKSAADLRIHFGATAEEAEKITTALIKGQYAGNLKKAEAASYQFARAMNLDYTEVANNTVELQKWGKISAETATAMYTDIMKVAQAHGLTEKATKSVMSTTTELSGYMRAYGKTEKDIQKMNSSLAKMASSMEKVGVSAEKATEIVKDLLDPERIEDNISKYAALGISISDAISGNIDVNQITEGMKEVGQRIKEMGPIAGKAYANAMGISYKDAIKSADLEQITEEVMTPEEMAADQMKQLTENTKNMTEKIQDSINKIEGRIQKLGPAVVAAMFVAFSIIKKKINLTERISKSIADGISKGVKEGSEKNKVELNVDIKDEKEAAIKEKKLKIETQKLLATEKGKKKYQEIIDTLKRQTKEMENQKETAKEQIGLIEKKRGKEISAFASLRNERDKILDKQKNGTKLTAKEELDLYKINNLMKIRKENINNLYAAQDKLNKESKKQNEIYKKTNEKIKEMQRELAKAGGVANKDFKISGKHFVSSVQQGARIFATKVKGSIKGLAGAGEKIKHSIMDGAKRLAEAAKESKAGRAVSKVGGGIAKLSGALGAVSIAITLIMTILKKNEKIQRTISNLMNIVGKMLGDAMDVMAPFIDDIATDLMLLFKYIICPVLKGLMSVLKAIMWPITAIAKVFGKNVEELKNNTDALNNEKSESKAEQIYTDSSGNVRYTKAVSGTSTSNSSSNETTSAGANSQKQPEVNSSSSSSSSSSAISELTSSLNSVLLKLDQIITMNDFTRETKYKRNKETSFSKVVQTGITNAFNNDEFKNRTFNVNLNSVGSKRADELSVFKQD